MRSIPSYEKLSDVVRSAWKLAFYTLFACLAPALSWGQESAMSPLPIQWRSIRTGLAMAVYQLLPQNAYVASEVLLFKIDPQILNAQLALATDFGGALSDIKQMTNQTTAVVGINASFFDPAGKPLGLILRNSQIIQKNYGIKRFGGIFYIKHNKPGLVSKIEELPPEAELAFQAFPRLIYQSQPIAINSSGVATRRSGIAITKNGQIIIFATRLRFPGATLMQIQQMLQDPRLEVTDALNLDGGGSSQLFLSSENNAHEEVYLTGGDNIPVGLIFKALAK